MVFCLESEEKVARIRQTKTLVPSARSEAREGMDDQYARPSGSESDNGEDESILFNDVSSEAAAETNQELQTKDGMTEEQRRCHRLAEEYIQNCLHFHLKIDPNVVVALRTGWDVLQPTRHFNDGSMLGLMGILEDNKTIRKLNLSNVGMQDAR